MHYTKPKKVTTVIKKNKSEEPFDPEKIVTKAGLAAERALHPLSDSEKKQLVKLVVQSIDKFKDGCKVSVTELHNYVENALDVIYRDAANEYRFYRNSKEWWNQFIKSGYEVAQSILFRGDATVLQSVDENPDKTPDKENSNTDSALVSTKRTLTFNEINKMFYTDFFLTPTEKSMHKRGLFYIHDMHSRRDTMNCCLFDIESVLNGGFHMGTMYYNQPHKVSTAMCVIGDVVLATASQQYGGFTLPEIDKVLEPYAIASYEAYYKADIELGVSPQKSAADAKRKTIKDIEQGFQGWEYKFNTVASSRGDYPFITVTLGAKNSKWAKLIAKAYFKVRRNGQGVKGKEVPPVFPKLVFLYDENLHGPGKPCEDVFEAAIGCSSKTMYPDYLSLTGDSYVSDIYKKYGLIISPMGCRAFLSPWYERGGMEPADENDRPVFTGRFNIGVVTMFPALIYAVAQREGRNYFEYLEEVMLVARSLHMRTRDYLGEMRASSNPVAYCEGGFYGGHLKPEDKIKPLLKTATASFGFTGLAELQYLTDGRTHRQAMEEYLSGGEEPITLKTLKFMNTLLDKWKKEDEILYAMYATPAEGLCGKQVKFFLKEIGETAGITDKPYTTNGFHQQVTEDLTPIEKQDLEYPFWDYSNGGKIQYVKYPIDYNIDAIKTLVRRAMKMGLYEGVNMSLAYCCNCGHQQLDMDICPCCGSSDLTKIDRMNGYLSYSRIHGDTRLNAAKMAEIAARVSM